MSLTRAGLIGVALLAGGLALPPGARAAAAAEPATLAIGALVDQTGASTSPHFRLAVELAAQQMNAALQRLGAPMRFAVAAGDTKSDPARSATEARRLITEQHAIGLVADSSGDTLAVNRLNYDPASGLPQVPITCFQCSSSFIHDPQVTDTDPLMQAAERDGQHWLFRAFYDARFEAAVIVRIAMARLRPTGHADAMRMAVYYDGGHRSLAEQIQKVLPSLCAKCTVTTTAAGQVAEIAAGWPGVLGSGASAADIVVVAMLPAAATEAIQSYRKGGWKTPIVSNNSFRRDYILRQVGAPANGLEGSSVLLADKGAAGRDFLNAFQAAYRERAEVTSSGAYDSAATLMLAAVLASDGGRNPAKATPAAVREALTRINAPHGLAVRPATTDYAAAIRAIRAGRPVDYQGAYDPMNWDAVGNIYPQMVRWTVEQGRFVEHELYDCTNAKPLCPVVGGK
jgi:ABC-type branched-subunit amino acid transport system substrate-binding protein